MFLLVIPSLLEVPDSILWAFVSKEKYFIDSVFRLSRNLVSIGGWFNRNLVRAIGIFRMFSLGPYTRWNYTNNSLAGKQFYIEHLIKHLGKEMSYDCDEVAQLLLRAFRDNGYRAFFYVPFWGHMTVIVNIDGFWVEFDGSYINYEPVRLLTKLPYFVILGDSVGYYDRNTYLKQRKMAPRYVSKLIPLLYRKAMSPLDRLKPYVWRYLETLVTEF